MMMMFTEVLMGNGYVRASFSRRPRGSRRWWLNNSMMLMISLLVEFDMMIMWKVNSRITEVVADLAERERTREGETREAEARSR